MYAGSIPAGCLPLVPSTTVLELAPAMADRIGLPPGTPIVAGAGDGPLGNLGVGAISPGVPACRWARRRRSHVRPVASGRLRTHFVLLRPDRRFVGGRRGDKQRRLGGAMGGQGAGA